MNQFVLVGTLKEKSDLKTTTNGIEYARFVLDAGENSNKEPIKFQFTAWKNLARELIESAKLNQMIGIKGRLSNNNFVKDDNQTYYNVDLVAEKVTILSTSKKA